jgi:hypothetical protein
LFSVSPVTFATPATNGAVDEPARVPPEPVAIATVALPVSDVTKLPKRSSAAIARAKLVSGATVAGGSAITTSCVAEAGFTLTALVTAAVSPTLLAWSL